MRQWAMNHRWGAALAGVVAAAVVVSIGLDHLASDSAPSLPLCTGGKTTPITKEQLLRVLRSRNILLENQPRHPNCEGRAVVVLGTSASTYYTQGDVICSLARLPAAS